MPIDTDAAFVAEIMALSRARRGADDFLADVIQRLRHRMPAWDWIGIYFLVDDTLVLGPYVGTATEHVRIPIGVGVCGTAVAQDTNVIVDDVRARDNYLACSLNTRSEIVVLIRDQGDVVAQFDVDSDRVGAFTGQDEALLERLADIVDSHCRVVRDRLALQEAAFPARGTA